MIKLTIPFMSISVNTAYAGNKRRYKSEDYVEFENKIKAFFLTLWEKWEIYDDNWLSVQYRFYFPLYNKDWSKKIKDTANYEKCLTDCLCKEINWFSDHKIKIMSLSKFDSQEEFMEIEIKELT